MSTQRTLLREEDLGRGDLADITILIDRSGSMSGSQTDVVEGLNRIISDNQIADGEANLTLIQFDDKFEVMYEGQDIKQCKFLGMSDYVPRGGTHLYDSVVRAINMTNERLSKFPKAERPGKVMLFVITDGGEQGSPECTHDVMQRLMTECREKLWTIVFSGCDEASLAAGANAGISASNTVAYTKGRGGARMMGAQLARGMSNLRSMSMEQYAMGAAGPAGPNGPPGAPGFMSFAANAQLSEDELKAAANWSSKDVTANAK